MKRHSILVADPHIKSLASLVLICKKYKRNEVEEWLEFRDDFLDRNKPLVCVYCGKKDLLKDPTGKKQPKNLATIDHVKPLSKGGSRYDESNLVVACYACNQAKGDKF